MSDQAVASRDILAPPPARSARLSRKQLAIAAAVLALSVAAATYGYNWWFVGRFIETTDDAYVGGDVTAIAPHVAGFITKVAVTDNQKVHAGDLLVKLDDRDYRAALAKAEAAVAGQKATLANLAAQHTLQQAVIAEAQAQLTATVAEIERSRQDVDRYRTLAQDHAASLQRSQQADADYQKALAADTKARAALEAAQRQLDVIETQRQQTVAALAAAVADSDTAQLNLGYTELRAPIDGVVGNRSAQTGAYATVGAPLISLVPAHGLWVDANFKENQLAHMHAGQPVTIQADVLSDRTFQGHVASLAPAAGAVFSVLPPENATGNFTKIVQRVPVRILLDGDAAELGVLRPGLSVTADVDER